MTSTPHTNCLHPSTKAARAKCRKDRALAYETNILILRTVIHSYYDNSGDVEEIISVIDRIGSMIQNTTLTDCAKGFYDSSLTIEEVIGTAAKAIRSL